MEQSDILYQLALALVPGVGTKTARILLEKTGSPANIFKEKPQSLKTITGIGDKIIRGIRDSEIMYRAETEMRFMESRRINMVFMTDPGYPDRLAHCADAPLLLFYKGTLPSQMKHSLSVIGTRSPTQRGRERTIRWIQELAEAQPDLYIVSGLAYGIDIAAHEAALTSNLITLGVLGHGFHTLYPKEHREAAKKMLEKGALISDFFSNNLREPKNFIRRNRIIAGLTEATLVMESQIKGGAMATAEMALGYNREVLAVPGRPDDPNAAGCNYLIYSNQATLVRHIHDIRFVLGWTRIKTSKTTQSVASKGPEDMNDQQARIMELIRYDELNINEISMLLKVHPAQLTGDLLTLEFGGYIKASPGGRFKAV